MLVLYIDLHINLQCMVVVETKDAEQANEMKRVLESKYDHLTMTSIGIALGVKDVSTTDGDTDSDSDQGDENEEPDRGPSAMPRSPLPQRKRMTTLENKAGGMLSIPIASVATGRRGSMMVQTTTKVPEWKVPDHSDKIEWSSRATHYPVHSSH